MEKLNSKGQNLQEFLAEYKASDYPHPNYTCDMIILGYKGKQLKVLLIKRANHPCIGEWALPGGFVNPNETSEECAARELKEETGIVSGMGQLYTVTTPNRDPRGWTISTVFCGVVDKYQMARAGDDASEAKWFDIDYKYTQNSCVLKLYTDKDSAQVTLKIARDDKNFMDINKTELENNTGIAFDHAKLILYALETLLKIQGGESEGENI